ncbi:hypothetical protein [Alteribacillus iranensis]|nr:hypothetical protein [Alteribacillus iranensis]
MEQIANTWMKQQPQHPQDTIKKGDVLRGQIVKRGENQEAVVRVNGKQVNVQFEEGIPKEDKVTLQITGKDGDTVRVRAVESASREATKPSPQNESITQALKQAGVEKPSPDFIKAVKTLRHHHIPLTKETVQELKAFLSSADGRVNNEKMVSVQAAAAKKIPITEQNLRFVNESLHGSGLKDVIATYAGENKENINAGQMEKMIQQAVQQAAASIDKRGAETEESNAKTTDRRVELLRTLLQTVKSEPNLQSFIDQLEKDLQSSLSAGKQTNTETSSPYQDTRKEMMQGLSQPMREELLKGTEEAAKLLRDGKELASRQQLHHVLVDMEKRMSHSEPNLAADRVPAEVYTGPVNTGQAKSKLILETRVTNKLIEITNEFQSVKKDTAKILDQSVRLLEQKPSAPQAKQILEGAIKQLDRTILKSEMMLYADMKTEKSMLAASSQLREAHNLLQKGNIEAARSILQKVKQQVDTWSVQMSERKVRHIVAGQVTKASEITVPTAAKQVMQQAQLIQHEPGARPVFELIRSLGLNREGELGSMLLAGRKSADGESQAMQQHNLKEALLQAVKVEEGNSRIQQANQALSNLSGQQLLSKADHPTSQPQLLFNLPVPLKDNESASLQVYVQSRQSGERVDWENCSLYFLIDTPSLGETGIAIQVQNRQLSITLNNDQQGFDSRMKPLVEKAVHSISELGYHIQDIRFRPFSPIKTSDKEVEEKAEQKRAIFTEEGFDYKI